MGQVGRVLLLKDVHVGQAGSSVMLKEVGVDQVRNIKSSKFYFVCL